ncbi:hypothetical protein QQF64_018527 [Cirrhinus molitorella]|uniref:SET domain-containing protein n=1 Tax=Cirrhinus molitorella TaxID=172907 RepID=A0ABR3LCU1_9TELE
MRQATCSFSKLDSVTSALTLRRSPVLPSHADTAGRRINHSSKRPNLKPLHCVLKVGGEDRDVILFRALRDINVDTHLKFDYGVEERSIRGEGLDLDWLDEYEQV